MGQKGHAIVRPFFVVPHLKLLARIGFDVSDGGKILILGVYFGGRMFFLNFRG